MARKRRPEPFWRTQTKCYYVKVGGKQRRLSPDKDEAYRLYHEIMAKPPEERAEVVAPGAVLVDRVLEDYMDWIRANRSPSTLDIYSRLLQKFVEAIPATLAVADLRPFHVSRVMDAHAATWSANTRRNFAVTVQGALNWAEKQGLIDRNPIKNLAKPSPEAREMAVGAADHAKILAAIDSPGFRDVVELAWETGCRPQEVRAIEARHVDWEAGKIVFPPKESKGRRAHRVIYFGTEKAREIVARLAVAHPEGPILRNAKGNPWTKDAINCAFCRVKKKTGVKFHMGAYRKGFVTEAIKNGVDTITLARLVGHSDSEMIARVYSKVHRDAAYMAEASRRAKGEVKGGGSTGS